MGVSWAGIKQGLSQADAIFQHKLCQNKFDSKMHATAHTLSPVYKYFREDTTSAKVGN